MSTPQPGTQIPEMDDIGYAGDSVNYAREDHVHPNDTSKADLISPAFVGTPTAPTAAVGTATTQIATTDFVAKSITQNNNQELPKKQNILVAGRNITLTAQQDGSVLIEGVDLASMWAEVAKKQNLLNAGTNITLVPELDGTVTINASGGGAGLEYWVETVNRFYREGIHAGISGLENYLKPSSNEVGHWQSGNGWLRCMVTRLKGNVRNVIIGYSINNVDRHPIITYASTEPLDFEWGWSNNTFYPPYGVTTWADKDTYPVPREGYDWYFGWDTGTVTYEGETWYVLLIDTYTWAGGTAITSEDGIASFIHSWEDNPQSIGLTLLETAHAVPYTTAITEIGTENYAFKYGGDDKTYTYIDTDGNALFNEITTKDGTLTSQMSAKQDNIIAGTNVQIEADGKTISTTDTNEITELVDVTITNLSNGEILKYDATNQKWVNAESGTVVEANPSGTSVGTLNKIAIDGDIYSLPSGGGGGGGSFVGLTKSQYDALPTADKEDTSKLYFVQEGGGQIETTDLIGVSSDWGMYREGSMTITWNSNDEIVFDWVGGSSIGGDIVKIAAIPANASKIRFKITTGSAYDTTTQRFKLGIGVRTTYTTGVVLDGYNTTDWLAFKNFDTTNSVWEDELDLSNVTVDTYLYIIAHGWDATINKLEMVTADSSEVTYHTYWNNAKRAQWNQVKELTQAEYNALSTDEKQNGNLYLTHDGGYDFFSYDNGKIIVRTNTTTGERIWYFNGFTKTADDMTVPSELVPYLPTQTQSGQVALTWAWIDDTSTTRNGAVGFLYPGTVNVKIRSWNNNYSQLMGGTFWGTLIIDDAGEQHNNYSAPTEGLSLLPNRIYYNNTLYADNAIGGSNQITYGTTTPTGDANDGDLYILLDSNNSKQGEYLYMNNAWVQIE